MGASVDAVLPGRRGIAWLAHGVVRRPFAPRAARELVFCVLGVGFGLTVAAVVFAPAILAGLVATGTASTRGASQPAVAPAAGIGVVIAIVLVLLLAAPTGRGVGRLHRRLAADLLAEHIPAPAPLDGSGKLRWFRAALRDGPGWRAVAYSLLKLPMAVLDGYAVLCWVGGVINVSYPFWWRLFRNHPPDVHLSAVPVLTPFGAFHVATFGGTFAVFAAGVAMLLAAPWVTHGATVVDRRLMRALLGPGRLAERVRALQESRAWAVDDAAARLRRVERDLHDGAQIRLATLAMNLGIAQEKLGTAGDSPDIDQARELVGLAHRSAKDALVELRDLVRGIHPPVLDNGLPDALATLATSSAIPVELTTIGTTRAAPAIETIAYFCAAELLANAAKHSRANQITMSLSQADETLTLCVMDDGVGGAAAVDGTGLAGLAQRVATVDGRLRMVSPIGGPTRVTVELPRHT
jgi:signal transduction histidine kinase